MESPTIYSVLVLTFFFCLSLFGAFIVLKILKGTAAIQRKGVQLGGSAAMFVVMFFMLNKYLPEMRFGFIEEASAEQEIMGFTNKGITQIATVEIRPSTQLITSIDLRNLDRNKYFVERQYGVAVPKVDQAGWVSGEQRQLPIVSVADVPALGMGLSAFKAMFGGEEPKIFGIRSPDNKTITLKKNSSINEIDLSINLFEQKEYFKPMVKAQLSQMIEMGVLPSENIDEIPEQMYELMRSQLSDSFNTLIERKLPISKKICSGVFVLPFSKEFLESSLISKAGNFSLLDKALMYVSLSGIFGAGTNGNLFIDQKRKIVSFNATVRMRDVEIDDKTMDVIINNIGFITAGTDQAFFVLLVYSSTDDVTIFQELEKVLNELRFYG